MMQDGRARRLAGALELPFVDSLVVSDPVILIDDVVDSRWTFTVISALLKQGGSGPVFPFALASTARM